MGPMKGPENTLPMMMGQGPFGPIGMGGMFTLVKIRERITAGSDPGWYDHTDVPRAGRLSRSGSLLTCRIRRETCARMDVAPHAAASSSINLTAIYFGVPTSRI